MNISRRAEISRLITRLEDLSGEVSDITDEISSVMDEEGEYLSNMPESLQQSERGQTAEAAVDHLVAAYDQINDWDVTFVITALEDARDA